MSGDTTAGALRRLDWALGDNTAVLVVALGGNDALRGLSIDDMRNNLGAIIEQAQQRGATVILAGMEAPPNLGPDYTSKYHAVFPELAARFRVKLVPFLLQGVAGVPELNQRDGIHPTAEGARKVAENLFGRGGAGRPAQRVAMIELRQVSKTVTSGNEPLTILLPPRPDRA